MATVSRSTKVSGGTTLQSNTLARAADVETDMLTLFNAHNNHDAGTSQWTTLQATGSSTVPLIINNSTGTQNIANFQDNGSNVLTIADGGNVTFTGKLLGPDGTAAAPTYSFASSGNTDNGLYLAGTDNPAISAGGTKRLDVSTTAITAALPLAMGSSKITGLAAATANGDAVRYEQNQYRQAAVQATTTTATNTSSTTYVDTALSASITPTSSSSRIKVTVSTSCTVNTATETVLYTLKRGSDLFANGLARVTPSSNSEGTQVSFTYIDSPATTSSTTYILRIKSGTGTQVNDTISSVTSVMILEELI